MLISAVVAINLAFVCYSIGVLGEYRRKRLTWGYLSFFWAGLFFDILGTSLMGVIASEKPDAGNNVFHQWTGGAALIIMLLHTLWATWILWCKDEAWKRRFHHYSLIAWLIWLIPFLSGAIMGMKR